MQEKSTISQTKFSELSERIKEIINTYFEDEDAFYSFGETNYKRIRLDRRKIMLFLSNGDVVNYTINKSNLAHLLGVNTDYLLSTGLYNESNSYDLLKKFLCNTGNIYKMYKDGIIDLNKLLSPYIEKKINAFTTNSFVNINNCEFVCKYDSNRTYGFNNESFNMDYIIVQKNENKYYLSILAKEDSGIYVPMSNQVFDSYEDLVNKFFPIIANQELTFIHGASIKQGYSEPKKLWLNAETRNERLCLLQKHSREFECIPNVLSTYLYSLKIISGNRDENNINNELFNKISVLIENKKVININKLGFQEEDISSEIYNLVNSYNNSLFDNNSFDEGKLFTDIQEKNKDLKKELKEALSKIEELTSKYNFLEGNFKDRELEVERLNKIIEDARKVLN